MRKKNYNKLSQSVLASVEQINSNYIRVGKKVLINEENIQMYGNLGLRIVDGELKYKEKILPPVCNGRYSKYNCVGRQIKRKDLPKIDKIFWGECYPYGNTNASKVSFNYTRKVYQVEEWLPEFIKISVNLQRKNGEDFYVLFEIDDILDKTAVYFQEELLFLINLLQENIGDFEIYEDGALPSNIEKIQYIDWELLPPGEIDEKIIKMHYNRKVEKELREIIERVDYIKSLKPIYMIKGTNYFSKYFGAKFNNGYVVLENVERGNAIYVFKENWEELTKLSRGELRKRKSDKVIRIVHSGNWQQILKSIIG